MILRVTAMEPERKVFIVWMNRDMNQGIVCTDENEFQAIKDYHRTSGDAVVIEEAILQAVLPKMN